MKSKWENYSPINPDVIDEMMEELKLPRPVVRVLNNRGYTELDKVRDFLNPETGQLHDPFIIRDMDLAVNRVITALREREEILIFGDYDVDGITSVSLLYLFLKEIITY